MWARSARRAGRMPAYWVEDAGRPEGVLDAFDGAAGSGGAGVVLVGDEVQEGGVAAGGGTARAGRCRSDLPLDPAVSGPTVGRRLPKPEPTGVVTETGLQPGPMGWMKS